MLFISHDLLSVASIGHRIEILHEGRIIESGAPETIFREPKQPFTQELVRAIPRRLDS
jgi:ABC-type dipeptide/oligopeptide/nickel transport system ATPase component